MSKPAEQWAALSWTLLLMGAWGVLAQKAALESRVWLTSWLCDLRPLAELLCDSVSSSPVEGR